MKKSERLNLELAFLSDKTVFQLQDLMTTFEISKRTALRDVAALEELGLPLYSEVGPGGGYKITQHRSMIPIYFNNQEVSAIFFALKALSNLSSTPFLQSYPRITDKLMASLSPSQQITVKTMQGAVHYYSGASISHPQFLNDFLTIILETQIARILSPARWGAKTVEIQAFELLYRNGIWFCDAVLLASKEWVTLRIDQVEAFKLVNDSPTIFDRSQLYELKQHYEKTHHDIAFRCLLTQKGAEKFEKNHYPNMHLRVQGEQYELCGGYNKDEYEYMIEYLVSLGAEVKVQSPPALKQGYVAKLKALLANYE
ncbi:helix-turn-helix transcriptional regulator [Enterococcus pingfangensis]